MVSCALLSIQGTAFFMDRPGEPRFARMPTYAMKLHEWGTQGIEGMGHPPSGYRRSWVQWDSISMVPGWPVA
jgi:hypothetical protein